MTENKGIVVDSDGTPLRVRCTVTEKGEWLIDCAEDGWTEIRSVWPDRDAAMAIEFMDAKDQDDVLVQMWRDAEGRG